MITRSQSPLILLLLAIMLTLTHRADALIVSKDCATSNDTDFFNLTAFEVAPYIPSVDEEGNPYLKGAALKNAEVNHYRLQYEEAPLVRMPIDRYASLTSQNPDALKNFESRLVIVDPECNELQLFFRSSSVPFCLLFLVIGLCLIYYSQSSTLISLTHHMDWKV